MNEDTTVLFDGRTLFHQRRHDLHNEINKLFKLAVTDVKYYEELCAVIQNLHREIYHMAKGVKTKYNDMFFNDYVNQKLDDIMTILDGNTRVYVSGSGNITKEYKRENLLILKREFKDLLIEFAQAEGEIGLDMAARKSYKDDIVRRE